MYLIYRFIFVLSDTHSQMKQAAVSRLGTCDFRTSCRTFGSTAGNLLVASLKKADTYYDSLLSRCYDGDQLKKEIRELPQRNVIYIRLFGDYKLNDYAGTWMHLIQFVKEQNLPMGDPSPLCIYHDDPKVTPTDKLRTDVCMLLPSNARPKGNVGFKQLPAGRYATFLYKGSYDQLQAVYDTIYGKYLPEMECTLSDEPSAERYLNDPSCTPPEELLTEIYIPIR